MNAFNPPPAYFELYTSAARDDPSHVDHDLFTPPPPVEKPFLKFNAQWSPDPTEVRLDPNVRRLFDLSSPTHPIDMDNEDPSPAMVARAGPGVVKRELHVLVKQITQRYAALLDIVAKSPPPPPPPAPGLPPPMPPSGEALHELWTAFNNTATLISLLRTSQAHAVVNGMLERQAAAANDKAAALEAAAAEAKEMLRRHGLLREGEDDISETESEGE